MILGGDLLTALKTCVDMGIAVREEDGQCSPGIRNIGYFRGIPVYHDELLPPNKVLVGRKGEKPTGIEDTHWIKMS